MIFINPHNQSSPPRTSKSKFIKTAGEATSRNQENTAYVQVSEEPQYILLNMIITKQGTSRTISLLLLFLIPQRASAIDNCGNNYYYTSEVTIQGANLHTCSAIEHKQIAEFLYRRGNDGRGRRNGLFQFRE